MGICQVKKKAFTLIELVVETAIIAITTSSLKCSYCFDPANTFSFLSYIFVVNELSFLHWNHSEKSGLQA